MVFTLFQQGTGLRHREQRALRGKMWKAYFRPMGKNKKNGINEKSLRGLKKEGKKTVNKACQRRKWASASNFKSENHLKQGHTIAIIELVRELVMSSIQYKFEQ